MNWKRHSLKTDLHYTTQTYIVRNTHFNNMNMVCPKYIRESEGGRIFTVRTIKDWNALDVSLRKDKSISTFKCRFYNQILRDQKSAMRLEISQVIGWLVGWAGS